MTPGLQSSADTGSGAGTPVLHELNQACRALERLAQDLRGASSLDGELRQIASRLVAAVQRDADVALASIFLNQIAGLYSVRHCVETAIVVALMESALDKDKEEVLTATAAALTMNVGMLKEVESFQSRAGALSHAERAMLQRHPIDSADLLREAGVSDQAWLDCVRLHHEAEDGSGYPEGLSGDAIPFSARLVGLADRYCAHVSARNYRRSLLPPAAIEHMTSGPEAAPLARLLKEQIGSYPPGTLVQLANGSAGVVARRQDGHSLPVYVLRPAEGGSAGLHRTDESGYDIAAALHEDQLGMRFSMRQIWGEAAAL